MADQKNTSSINWNEVPDQWIDTTRRSLLVWAVATSVLSITGMRTDALAQEVKVAQAWTTNAVRTASLWGSTFDEVMAKDGWYAGIVKEFLGTSDPQIIAFIKREGDRYIASLPESEKRKWIRNFRSNLQDILGNANGNMPAQSSIDFFIQNTPQLLIEFARYPDKYPNLASKGKLLIADRRLKDETEFWKKLDWVLKKTPWRS